MSDDRVDHTRRIPRSETDDYSETAVDDRRRWLGVETGARLDALSGTGTDPHVFRGNVENLIGTVQLPVGVAGPLAIHGEHVDADVFVPLATTEGALVASYNRGMKAITASGGARARVVGAELSAGVTFILASQAGAQAFALWLDGQPAALRACAEATTRHGKLRRVEPRPVGRRAFVNFVYDTGDALGINMATVATAAACDWIMRHAEPKPLRMNLPGGLQGEKWANALDYLHGRGRRVTAEATIAREVLARNLHADAPSMHEAWLAMTLAKLQGAGLGISFHAANAVAALMLATGQDAAYLTAFTAITVMEALPAGDLYLSVDIPTLGVGTVGGGTGLPTARACLELLGCVGAGTANRLAEIAAATCLAGEASTVAAIVAGEFVAAHQTLGRNRPAADSPCT